MNLKFLNGNLAMFEKTRQTTYKIIFLGGILILLAWVILRWYHEEHQPEAEKMSSNPRRSQSQMNMQGFTYTISHHGKPLLNMKAGSLKVGKKKIGFISLGGHRQIELRDLIVDYYEPRSQNKIEPDHQRRGENIQQIDGLPSSILTAIQSFARNSGRLAGFWAQNVRFHYHHPDETQTDISGDLLQIMGAGQYLRFSGHAQISYRQRTLFCDEIFFHPENGNLSTGKNCGLTIGSEGQVGNDIKTDLRLNPLSAINNSAGELKMALEEAEMERRRY
jgi:hypothetical protein